MSANKLISTNRRFINEHYDRENCHYQPVPLRTGLFKNEAIE